jgi:hypothetical protein
MVEFPLNDMGSVQSRELNQNTECGTLAIASQPDSAMVRLQLDRLLLDARIRNSKRCQAMLRYVVEGYLAGTPERLKERAIGAEVFHREPGYDTNQDSVVRTTAAELRKRIAQYYLEPAHRHDLRIVLPPGSYVPEFRPAPALDLQPEPAPVVAVSKLGLFRQNRNALILAGTLLLAVVIAGAWRLAPSSSAELDAFWKPLLDDHASAVICIGQPLRTYTLDGPRSEELNRVMFGDGTATPPTEEVRRGTPMTLAELKPAGDRYFRVEDAIDAGRLVELMAHKNKPFQLLGDRMTSYNDLRGRPAILIGQFNNHWTMGLMNDLRYYLEKNNVLHTYEVHDRTNPAKLVASTPQTGLHPAEYAIVSRVFDASTEKTVVATAGMTHTATSAGADFLTNPAYMREAFRAAPNGWWNKNIQVVLKNSPLNGVAGPPSVVAIHYW